MLRYVTVAKLRKMIPPQDNYPAVLERVVARLLDTGAESARHELAPIACSPREMARRPSLPAQLRLSIFERDSWLCRYCGAKTIFTPVMALLGDLFPDAFPYHQNWKNGLTHPAVISRSAVVDHVVPGSLGGSWTDPDNLTMSCWPCNERKGDLTLEQMGWGIQPVPVPTGWDGLLASYRNLWEAAGRPRDGHQEWLRALEKLGR